MGLRLLAVFGLLTSTGCYLSHQLHDDAGRERDAGTDGPLISLPRIDAGVPMHPIGELAVGAWATVGMRRDGTAVWWGNGNLDPTEIFGITDALHVATSGPWGGIGVGAMPTVCAVRSTGRVRCLGSWSCGDEDVPYLDDAVELALASRAACAVRATGGVECWGDTSYGELGYVDRMAAGPTCRPREIPGIFDAIHVAASEFGFCAVHRSGGVTCWGEGIGTPIRVDEITDAIAVSSGDYCRVPSTCALRASGEVMCWGLTFWNGPIDPCDARESSPPTRIDGIDDAVGIATNGAMLCATRRSGDVVCTGVETLTGAMGVGMPWHTVPLGVPQAVVPPTTMLLPTPSATFIGVGNTFSCALLASGAVVCSGANTLGELGDGLVGDSLVPVPVLGL